MRIALATAEGSDLISQDDRLLSAALRNLDVAVEVPIWSDPSVDWALYDLVAIRTTWDYHLTLDAFLTWIARMGTKVANSGELIRWNAHKSYLLELEKKGVPIVPTAVLSGGDPIPAFVAEKMVIKPEVGASAQLTFVVASDDQCLIQERLEAVLERGKAMIQPYFDRIETEGELSLVWIGGEVAHAIQKRPKPGDFRVQIDYGGSNARVEPPQDALDLAAKCIAALPIEPAFARVDAVRDNEGKLRLMELELIEPELMFQWAPESAMKLARRLLEI